MNLVLFNSAEIHRPLPRSDRRASHVLQVLQRGVGDSFDAGLINGPRGRATITTLTADAVTISFAAQSDAPAAEPITLLVGLPRPQTARDILRDATTLGVAALHFVQTEKGEPSYAQSSLWSTGEWQRHVIAGAEQAFVTRIPDVTWGQPLVATLTTLGSAARLALDNYESQSSLSEWRAAEGKTEVVLAVGSERGWSAAERTLLCSQGFQFRHLGPRPLRTETACTAALTLVRTQLGLM